MELDPAIQETLTTSLQAGAATRGLRLNGAFHPSKEDGLHEGVQTVVMLSPSEDFWPVFTSSHEYQGGLADPMDRWSRRTIGRWACEIGAKAYFPFTVDPPRPFYTWAQRTKQAWPSPVTLLVDNQVGLMTSFRGALGLREKLDFDVSARPCDTCDAPCARACPVGALTVEGYDVPSCVAYLRTNPRSACRTAGCQVRLACPVSRPQTPEHAQFHMAAFLR